MECLKSFFDSRPDSVEVEIFADTPDAMRLTLREPSALEVLEVRKKMRGWQGADDETLLMRTAAELLQRCLPTEEPLGEERALRLLLLTGGVAGELVTELFRLSGLFPPGAVKGVADPDPLSTT